MVAKAVGNRGAYWARPKSSASVGISQIPDGLIGWTAIVGKSGDKAYLTAASLNSNNKLQQGYSFQSGGGATVEFTLCNDAYIQTQNTELLESEVLWGNSLTVPAGGAIVFATFPFTGIRITLTGDGETYIVSH